LKLITPTRNEEGGDLGLSSTEGYQLAHDFLVEPVRNWVELARKSTWRGRAVARLAELSELWQRKPQRQFFPTLREYAAMQMVVPSSSRNEKQAKYMRAAGRYHAGRVAATTVATVVAVIFAVLALQQYNARVTAERNRIGILFDMLDHGPPETVRKVIDQLVSAKAHAREFSFIRFSSIDPKVRLRAALFAHFSGEPSYSVLAGALNAADKDLAPEVIEAFREGKGNRELLATSIDDSLPLQHRARAALLLLSSGSTEGVDQLLATKPNFQARGTLISEAAIWRPQLTAIQELLTTTNSTDVQYLAIAILGYFPKSELDKEIEWNHIESLQLPEIPGLFSATDWLLQRNQVKRSKEVVLTLGNAGIGQTSNGLKLIRVGAGAIERKNPDGTVKTIRIESPLLVSWSPIERGLFDKFLAEVRVTIDGLPMPAIAPNNGLADEIENHPQRAIRGICFDMAIEFCNWLSAIEGLEKVYSLKDVATSPRSRELPFIPTKWSINLTATGYRLPTVDELEYFSFGDDMSGMPWLLSEQIETVSRNRPMTMRLANPRLGREIFPNRLGFFYFDTDIYYYVEAKNQFAAAAKLNHPRFLTYNMNPNEQDLSASIVVLRTAPSMIEVDAGDAK
jgi:hypothetical protein